MTLLNPDITAWKRELQGTSGPLQGSVTARNLSLSLVFSKPG